jgi:hypothetical protein
VGVLCQVHCGCGYLSRELTLDVGMCLGPVYDLATCEHCREIIAVDTQRPRLRCSRCGRKPSIWDSSWTPEAHALKCPRCRAQPVCIERIGTWD